MKNKILIVDDCIPSRDVLKTIVEGLGFVAELEEDGAGAIRHLAGGNESIGLVLLDIYMPQIDGISALGHIRNHYPDMPVIIISGGGDSDDERVVKSLGAKAYIAKPYSAETVRDAIRRLMHIARPRERTAS